MRFTRGLTYQILIQHPNIKDICDMKSQLGILEDPREYWRKANLLNAVREAYCIVNDSLDGDQYPETRHFDVGYLLEDRCEGG